LFTQLSSKIFTYEYTQETVTAKNFKRFHKNSNYNTLTHN